MTAYGPPPCLAHRFCPLCFSPAVDTHVWALATKYYTPHLRGKTLTKKVHAEVQAAFVDRFGPYAG